MNKVLEKKESKINEFLQALTILEKKKVLDEQNIPFYDDATLVDTNWLNIRSLVSESTFNDELKMLNIKKEEFSYLLREDDHNNLYETFLLTQRWYQIYEEAINLYESGYNNDNPVYDYQLCLPFIQYYYKHIECLIHKYTDLCENYIINQLCNQFILELETLTFKCIIVEMDNNVDIAIHTEDHHKNYIEFIKKMYKTPEQLNNFYKKYPVLTRLLAQKTMYIIDYMTECLCNLSNDLDKITQTFCIESPRIRNIVLSNGDHHEKNKTVMKIEFNDKTKLYYKPKNLYVEKEFNVLINHINKSDLLDLYINKVYYGKDFTLELEVMYLDCSDKEQISRYYNRYGMLLCLVSFLQGSDMHEENIIAHGEYPSIVDFETLFNHSEISDDISLNVVGTCLLPIEFTIDDNVLDISGLANNLKMSVNSLVLCNKYTDLMCYKTIEMTYEKKTKNIPRLNGTKVTFCSYKKDIVSGFLMTLKYIKRHKDEIKKLLDNFKNLKVRQVIKDTKTYCNLLEYVNHPNYLQHICKLEKLLENNWSVGYKDRRVIPYEIKDMLNMDVPIFYTYTDKKTIITSEGKHLENYYDKSSVEYINEYLDTLSEEQIKKEVKKLMVILDLEYPSLRVISEERSKLLSGNIYSNIRAVTEDIFNKVINRYIEKQSSDSTLITWKCIRKSLDINTIIQMDNSFGNGTAGIFIYLYYVNSKYQLKTDILDKLESNLDIYQNKIEDNIYDGSLGIIYILFKINSSKIDIELVEDVLISLKHLCDKYDQNEDMSKWEKILPILVKCNVRYPQIRLNKQITEIVINKIITSLRMIINEKKEDTQSLNMLLSYLKILILAKEIMEENLEIVIQQVIVMIEDTIKNVIKSENIKDYSLVIDNANLLLFIAKYYSNQLFDSYIEWAITVVDRSSSVNCTLDDGLAKKLDFYCNIQRFTDIQKVDVQIKEAQVQLINSYYYTLQRNKEYIEYIPLSLLEGISGIGYSLIRSIDQALPSIFLLN